MSMHSHLHLGHQYCQSIAVHRIYLQIQTPTPEQKSQVCPLPRPTRTISISVVLSYLLARIYCLILQIGGYCIQLLHLLHLFIMCYYCYFAKWIIDYYYCCQCYLLIIIVVVFVKWQYWHLAFQQQIITMIFIKAIILHFDFQILMIKQMEGLRMAMV